LATPRQGLRHDDQGAEGVAPGKVKVPRGSPASGATMGWQSELSPTVFDGVDVAAVAGADGEVSLQHRGVMGEENGGPKWE
jgi:hypothetical protein